MVAHFHYVLFGTIVFATYAGIYFWFPKMTGRLLDERLGKLHFWLTFIGFHTTFLVQHWLGDEGMPRRYADYLPTDGFTTLNIVSTIGALIVGVSTIPFTWNVFKSWRYGEPVTVDDPWGYTHWNGPPASRRHGTTSPSCPASVRSVRPSNCTIHTGADARRGPRGREHPSGGARGRGPIELMARRGRAIRGEHAQGVGVDHRHRTRSAGRHLGAVRGSVPAQG